jgi:hypothetical protein
VSHDRTVKRMLGVTLLSGGVAVALLGVGAATAQADRGFMPPVHGLLPEDEPVPPGASGPYKCCPGDPMGLRPSTGHGCPSGSEGLGVNWDRSQCHTWWGVVWGHGNVDASVWEGPDPPPPEATQKPWCGFPFMCSGTP